MYFISNYCGYQELKGIVKLLIGNAVQEIVLGIRYGTIEGADLFLPPRDSTATVIRQPCSETLLKLIYSKLNRPYSQLVRPFQ
jgi:hypothetical protein